MKVLFVTFEFQSAVSGGVGRVINGLAPELARCVRLDVLVVSCSFWRRRRLQLHEVSASGRPEEKGPRLLDTPDNLVRLVAHEGYEVVHFFCVSPIITRKIEALRTRLPRVKRVFSVHNLLEHEKAVRATTRKLLRHERRTLRVMDHIHVLNHSGLRYLSESYPAVALQKPISVIRNGLGGEGFMARDHAFWRALAPRVQGYRAVISCLSRWAPGKGHGQR